MSNDDTNRELDSWLADIHQDVLDTAEQLQRVRRAVGRITASWDVPYDTCKWCGVRSGKGPDGKAVLVRGSICGECRSSFRVLVARFDLFVKRGGERGN